MAAAGFAVSDAVAALWSSTWDRHGLQTFTEIAAPQLIRWESRYGWTRYGDGVVSEKETTLAVVLARMLRVADTWERFAAQYVCALDELSDSVLSTGGRRHAERTGQRAGALRDWHDLLLENLAGEDPLLDSIAGHASLRGAEQVFISARLAHRAATPTMRATW